MQLRFFPRFSLLYLFVVLPGMTAAKDLLPLARSGDLAGLKMALPESSEPDPETLVKPLYFASQLGREEVVIYLLSLGARPDSATVFGTALGIAARNNHIGIVTALLAAGADPDLPGGENSMTPFHHAAQRGAMESARLLLHHGANLNAVDRWGWPAVQFAGSKERFAMVAFLREMGAGAEPVDTLRPGELEAADIEEGRVLAFECGGCHGLTPDQIGSGQHPGPNLVGLVGRPKASLEGFPYSKAMRAQKGRWTPEELNVFLADPFNSVPGTSMTRGGQSDRTARVSIIAYLAQLAP